MEAVKHLTDVTESKREAFIDGRRVSRLHHGIEKEIYKFKSLKDSDKPG